MRPSIKRRDWRALKQREPAYQETRGRVAASPPFAAHGLRALGEAGEMRARLAAHREQRGGEQAAEPGLRRSGSIARQAPWASAAARVGGRSRVFSTSAAPFGEARVLVPVEVIDQRIALAGGRRHACCAALKCEIAPVWTEHCI